MFPILQCVMLISLVKLSYSDPSFPYPEVKGEIFEQPISFMGSRKTAHDKDAKADIKKEEDPEWFGYDFSKFDSYLSSVNDAADPSSPEHNRIKRRAKRRHNRRKNKHRGKSEDGGEIPEQPTQKQAEGDPQVARRGGIPPAPPMPPPPKPTKKPKDNSNYDTYEVPPREKEHTLYVEMPKDLYQAHLRPGVIFRIHMSEAILKMQYRNYVDDSDESVIDADVEYLRLTRKVISDEITKFEDLRWLTEWFTNRSELIQEHVCNTRYYAVGIPPTMFTYPEEYMKRMCLFDNVYLDHIPYVIGADSSLMAAVAPPVLHCDAATCTSVPFIDSVMFDERMVRSNVRTVTRCQASCRAHCRNDPDCLKRCTDRCFRID